MKRLMIMLLMAMPAIASAQDNTWERVEVTPTEKEDKDAKYLVENAVPEVDGKVCWTTTIQAPGKSAQQIYDLSLAYLEKMTKEPNQIKNSSVVVKDIDTHQLGAVFHEWLVFKNSALSLDRTQMNFTLQITCYDGKAEIMMSRISYDYDLERHPSHWTAEEWITDRYCVNKKHTKMYPVSGKFRRKTIDRKDFIFNKFNSILNDGK